MRKLQLIFGLLLSLGCLYYAFRGISFKEVARAIGHADPRWLILALGVYACGFVIRAYRWAGLMKPIKPISAMALMPPMVIGFFANNVLPFRMGELVRAHVAGQKIKVSRSTALGTIVVERIFDTVTFLSMFLVVALFFPFPGPVRHGAYVLGAFCAGLIIALLIGSKHQHRTHALIARLPISETWQKKIQDLIVNFAHGVSGMTQGQYVIQALVLSIGVWIVEGTNVYLIAQAFPILFTYPQAYFVLFFLGLSVTLPQAPGYVGTVELFGATALSLLGIPREQGLPVILTIHGIQFGFVALLGGLALWKEGISLNRLLNRSELTTQSPADSDQSSVDTLIH